MESVADRLEMTEVGTAIEQAILGQLSVDLCGNVLMGGARFGLARGRVEAAARVLALELFEEVAGTAGFDSPLGWTKRRRAVFWTMACCV
jgi:hypothetical protein